MRAEFEHEVELSGAERVRVIDLPGPVGAPTVLLLHGLGVTARLNWGPSFAPLNQHFRVLSVDHRGHGRGLRTRRFRLEQCAEDAVRVAGARGVDRFVAVGYSMGGPIASLIWKQHPQRVQGLVLCATARQFVGPGIARAAWVMLPAAAGAARFAPRAVRARVLEGALSRVRDPEVRNYVMNELQGHAPASVIEAAHALTRFSSRAWIGGVDVPTAVIVTTQDTVVPPSRQYALARSIPDARVYEVQGDHGACIWNAERFVPTLVSACRDVARFSART